VGRLIRASSVVSLNFGPTQWFCALVIALDFCCVHPSVASAAPLGSHGVGLTLMTQVQPVDGGLAYQYTADKTAPILNKIRQSGADLVRLVVRPLPMLQGSKQQRAFARSQVLGVVKAASAAGLGVIVDFHPWTPDTLADEANLICTDTGVAAFQEALVAMAQDLASLRLSWVALEMLNEPKSCKVGGVIAWPGVQRRLYQAVRRVSPSLPIVVTPPRGQTDDILAFDPSAYVRDPNVLFTFHFYEPFIFTSPFYFHLNEVPFPPPGAIISGMAAYQEIDRSKLPLSQQGDLVRYLTRPYSVADIDKRFQQVTEWRELHRIAADRIFLGEFGLVAANTEHTPNLRRSELTWLQAVRSAALREGFRLSFWAWQWHAGFDYDVTRQTLRADVAAAIGLQTEPQSGPSR
jgi:endoglucanase